MLQSFPKNCTLGIVWFECKGWIKGYFLSSILCPFGHLSAIFEDFNITCSSGIGNAYGSEGQTNFDQEAPAWRTCARERRLSCDP